MAFDNSQSLRICPVLPENRSAALELAFGYLPYEDAIGKLN